MEEKLALINGIGITMDEDHPVCQGIYLKNGFIEKIGTSEAIKKLAEFDASGADTRLILSRDEVAELLRIFLPAGSNEAKQIDQVDSTLNKIAELGFIRRLRGQNQMIEVRRIIKAFVDAQWLADFDERLADYRKQLVQLPEELNG